MLVLFLLRGQECRVGGRRVEEAAMVCVVHTVPCKGGGIGGGRLERRIVGRKAGKGSDHEHRTLRTRSPQARQSSSL